MQEVGRNEPCPCGSGKKYKKCCANKKVVSIQKLLVAEQMDKQLQFLNEVMGPKQANFKDDLKYVLDHVTPSFNEPQFLTVYLTFLFGLRKEDDSSYWSNFLDSNIESTDRERMRELMENWHQPVPVMAEVTSMDEEVREIVIQDLIDDEEYTVILPEFHSWAPIDYLFAVLLPIEDKWVPYGFMLPGIYTKKERDIVIERISKLQIEGEDRSNWLETEMVTRMVNAIVARDAKASTDWIDQMVEGMDDADQAEAVRTLKEVWDERGNEDLSMFASHIATSYFAENGGKVRKPQTYLAAISYLMAQHATEEPMTQKEAGAAFNVSASSVSSTVRKIEEWFKQELEQLQKQA